jgi:hypothetical protein
LSGREAWQKQEEKMSKPVTKANAKKVLAALKKQQKSALGAGATPPTLHWFPNPDGDYPVILWEEGPYDWPQLFPYGGTDQEFGFSVAEVELPEGVFAEAQNGYSVGIFPSF